MKQNRQAKAELNKPFVQGVRWKNTTTDSIEQTTKSLWQTKILEQLEQIRDVETGFILYSISANEEEEE